MDTAPRGGPGARRPAAMQAQSVSGKRALAVALGVIVTIVAVTYLVARYYPHG